MCLCEGGEQGVDFHLGANYSGKSHAPFEDISCLVLIALGQLVREKLSSLSLPVG